MNKIKQIFILTASMFGLSGISPLLVPFSIGEDHNLNACGYITGVMFWLGLVLGIAGYVVLIVACKKVIGNKRIEKSKLPDALKFFQNKYAKITDGGMIIGVLGIILSFVVTMNDWFVVFFLVMTLSGVYGHFLFNGNVYKYIFNSK